VFRPFAVASMALAVSGCIAIDYGITVEEDGSGSVEASLGLDIGVLSAFAGDEIDREEACADFSAEFDQPDGITSESFDEGDICGLRIRAAWDASDDAESSLAAVLIALTISAVLLAVAGKNPFDAYATIVETGASGNKLLEMLRRATPLIFSATAVAIGFKMLIFNIGVEGQYLFAALIAAEAGSRVSLPMALHIAFILAIAVIAGAFWASIAGVLKVRKNVHEVISTIMLNYIALSVIQWLFENFFRDDEVEGLNIKTTLLPESAECPTSWTDASTGCSSSL